MYAIRRLKRNLNAWCWRVSFIRRGKPYANAFPDLKHGGRKQALSAAIKWRDKTLKKLDAMTMREFHELKKSDNTSGVPGVHFQKTRRQPLGFWQANIKFVKSGVRISKSF